MRCGMTPGYSYIPRHDTTLHRAAVHGNATGTWVMLTTGADPGGIDINGDTPLLCAADRGHVDVFAAVCWHRGLIRTA